jgi:hypothetical protein
LHHAVLSAPRLRFVQPHAGASYAVLKFGITRGNIVELQTANANRRHKKNYVAKDLIVTRPFIGARFRWRSTRFVRSSGKVVLNGPTQQEVCSTQDSVLL